MKISGTGITEFTIRIKPEFEINTKLALQWTQLSNGDWACTDRGAEEDRYSATVTVYDTLSVLEAIVDQIELNRVNSSASNSNTVTLSEFNSGEYIFGADIDYSGSITATINPGEVRQGSLNGFELELEIIAISPTFITGVFTELPILRYLDIGFNGNAKYTVNKLNTYSNVYYYQDRLIDSGTFTGTFRFDQYEMSNIRRLVATIRGGTLPLPTINGVTHVFGKRRGNPTNCRVTNIKDIGILYAAPDGPVWVSELTLVEAF